MPVADLRQETDLNQARASDPRASAWVSANAGTGKTTVLVNRVLRLLLHKDEHKDTYTQPETILCLTYTKAAVGEMENRLFRRLARWAVLAEPELAEEIKHLRGQPATTEDMTRARQLFAIALDTKGGLKIHTIHAFCERLLHRFPLEAGVSADFRVLEDQERRALREAAVDAVLARAAAEPGLPLGQALLEVVAATGEERFSDIVDVVLGHQDELHEVARHDIGRALGVAGERTDAVISKEISNALSDAQIDAALRDIPRDKPTERSLLAALGRARSAPLPERRARAVVEAFLTKDGKPRARLLTKAVKDALPDLASKLEQAQQRIAALAREQAALHVASSTGALLTLAGEIMTAYDRRKTARAALDYDDLIFKTAHLLQTSRAAAWVLYKLDYGIDHILVDEAQDTSPAQWRVIEALCREFFAGEGARDEERTIFAVGDEKQSIYSFQGADPASFAEQGAALKKAAEASGRRWERVPLTVSFRSTEPVLEAVDDVFGHERARAGVNWAGAPVVHKAVRAGEAGLVELWPLEEPDNHEPAHPMRPHEEVPAGAHARDRLVERIARTIRHWLDHGERLEARGRVVRAGDILVLVRSRDEFVARLIRALKTLDIPVAGADRMRLTEQLAVQDLMAVGDFALMPEDDLTLATVLKSPLVGFNDDDLFDLAYGRAGTLWDSLRDKAKANAKYQPVVERLSRWLGRADTAPPYEFFAGLLEERQTRMRLALIARLGADAGDAIDEFLNLALDYEHVASPSLQGFLHWTRKAEAEVKRDMEQGRDEVRVMTVHGAKGLEADIVILPDTCRPPSGGGWGRPRLLPLPRASAPLGEPNHLVWVPAGTMPLEAIEKAKDVLKQAERAEHNRLLYVAMTRTRDRLYVCGWKGSKEPPRDCWYALVSEGLDGLAKAAAGTLGEPVRRYACAQTAQAEKPTAPADGVPAPRSLPPWALRDAAAEALGALSLAPSAIPVATGSDVQLLEQDVVPPLERTDPSRFLCGTIVHALLEHLPNIAPEEQEETALAFVAARARALDDKTRAEIVSETLAILACEDFAPLFGPASQAEVPIVARIGRAGAAAIELTGQIDRLVVLDDEVLIVDYKTNRPPPKTPEEVAPLYRRQLAAYRHALRQAFPEKRVRTALLWTDGPHFMAMPDDLLDGAAAILTAA